MARILKNVDKIITSGPNSKEIDLHNLQASGGNKIMTIGVSGTQAKYYFGTDITFNVSTTTALSGVTIADMSYSIDGSTPVSFASSGTGSFTFQENTLVTYASNPTYTEIKDVVITVTDSLGNTESKTMSLTFEILDNYLTHTNGIVSQDGAYTVVKWLQNGQFEFSKDIALEYLIVGGGGGGGQDCGGGGGGGGYLAATNYNLTSGQYPVSVGIGGTGAPAATVLGTNGGNSSIGITLIAYGGGRGGHWNSGGPQADGADGGSGGGAGGWTQVASGGDPYPSQGNAGGNAPNSGAYPTGGGGGGAGGAGSTGVNSLNGSVSGGAGLPNSITGTSVTYAAGGKGAGDKWWNGVDGAANTGNGGDGEVTSGDNSGKSGGSGIVVIRFKTQDATVI